MILALSLRVFVGVAECSSVEAWVLQYATLGLRGRGVVGVRDLDTQGLDLPEERAGVDAQLAGGSPPVARVPAEGVCDVHCFQCLERDGASVWPRFDAGCAAD
jgi:hypothetical protein